MLPFNVKKVKFKTNFTVLCKKKEVKFKTMLLFYVKKIDVCPCQGSQSYFIHCQ